MRMVGDKTAETEFRPLRRTVENAPIAPGRAFQRPFPRLIESLDDIDAEILPLREFERLGDDPRLVRWRRPCRFAHPAGARPADFTDDNFLVGDGVGDLLADVGDVSRGNRSRQRQILPIRQDMYGDEVNILLQIGIAQPEFPDVGICDRHRYLRFYLADDGAEIGRRHLAAQQHLIADNDGADDIGIFLGEVDGGRDLLPVERSVIGEPQPHEHLQAVTLSDGGNLIEPVGVRISADAVGVARQQSEVLVDLLSAHHGARHQRILAVAKRRVGYAGQLAARGERRRRQLHWPAQPQPGNGDRQRRRREMRERQNDQVSLSRSSHGLPLASAVTDAK